MSKTVCRRRSEVGRMRSPFGPAIVRPRNSPPTMRTARLSAFRDDRLGLRRGPHRRLEVGAGGLRQLRAELIAQHLAADLAHFARVEVAELERTVGDADQPVGVEADM